MKFTIEHAKELIDAYDLREIQYNEEESEMLADQNPALFEATHAILDWVDNASQEKTS